MDLPTPLVSPGAWLPCLRVCLPAVPSFTDLDPSTWIP